MEVENQTNEDDELKLLQREIELGLKEEDNMEVEKEIPQINELMKVKAELEEKRKLTQDQLNSKRKELEGEKNVMMKNKLNSVIDKLKTQLEDYDKKISELNI